MSVPVLVLYDDNRRVDTYSSVPSSVTRRSFMKLAASVGVAAAFLPYKREILAAQQGGFGDRTPSITSIENLRPGTRDWEIHNCAKDDELEGYAYSTRDKAPHSASKGEEVAVCVNSKYQRYRVRLFRIGYYDGLYGREILVKDNEIDKQAQPVPQPNPKDFNVVMPSWTPSFRFVVPEEISNCPSGYYLWQLTGLDQNGNEQRQRYIPLIIRDDLRPSQVLVKFGTATEEAYNMWGPPDWRKSLYDPPLSEGARAVKVAACRPYAGGDGTSSNVAALKHIIGAVAFLEKSGLDVTYCDSYAIDAMGYMIYPRNKVFLTLAHDEYWSRKERNYIEDAPISKIFWGGNICYRQSRMERDINGFLKIACFKTRWKEDPDALKDPAEATREFSANPPNRPESWMKGTFYDSRSQLREDSPADIRVERIDDPLMDGTGFKVGDLWREYGGYEFETLDPEVFRRGINFKVLAGAKIKCPSGQEVRCDAGVFRAGKSTTVSASSINAIKALGPEGNPGIQRLLLNAIAEGSNMEYPWATGR